MKIPEIQTLFLNMVGTHLKQKGFKHTKTKGMYRLVKDNYTFTIWVFFFKYSSCIRLDLKVGIGYLPCEKIIKKEAGITQEYILSGDLKKIATIMSLPFDDNNKWNLLYNEKDATLKFQECINYLDKIIEPFWQQYSDIETLYKYIKPTILNRIILIPPTLENILNIITLAFLLKEDNIEYKNILTECHEYFLTIKKERFYQLFNNLAKYIEKESNTAATDFQ